MKKSTGSQFAFFFFFPSFFRTRKIYIFTLCTLSINNDHVTHKKSTGSQFAKLNPGIKKIPAKISVNQCLRHNLGYKQKIIQFIRRNQVYFSSSNVSTDTTVIVKDYMLSEKFTWGDKDSLVKTGVLSIEGGRYCFSLVINRFCSNSEEHKKISFPYEFMFTPYFIWAILSINATERWGFRKEK